MNTQVAEVANRRLSGSVDRGWELRMVSGVRWLLSSWLVSVVLLQQFCLLHRSQRLCRTRLYQDGVDAG